MRLHLAKLPLAALAALASAGASAQLNLYFVGSVDLAATSDPAGASFIGTNPAAVEWNGTDLIVAGFNGGTTTANTGLVRVSSALTAPTLGPTFGAISTTASRGHTGLALAGTSVYSSWDNGVNSTSSYRAFDAAGTQLFASGLNVRGIGGVGIDPGFNGSAARFSGLTVGSGRRLRGDLATGAEVNGVTGSAAPGAIITPTGAGSTWRDHVYDPATGDLYARESNRVTKAVRSGDNTFTGLAILNPSVTVSSTTVGQNVELLADASGKFLMYNDRTGSATVNLTDAVKAMDTNGNAVAISYFGFTPGTGVGLYDFAYDAPSGTLALLDYTNRSVTLFSRTQPVPEPMTLAALGLGVAALLRRRKAGA